MQTLERITVPVNTRNTEQPVPDNWQRLLTYDQVLTINQFGNYGWDLWFIRRCRRHLPTPVLRNDALKQVVVVSKEGELVRDHGLRIRD